MTRLDLTLEGRCMIKARPKEDPMYKFTIKELNCMSCVHNITEDLKELDGSIKVTGDVKNKTLQVESLQSKEQVVKVIETAGYTVTGELP